MRFFVRFFWGALLLLGLLIYGLFLAFPRFAAAVDTSLGAPLRSLLSSFSSALPFSLTEWLLLCMPALFLLLLLFLLTRRTLALGGLSLFFVLFLGVYILTFASGAHRPSLAEELKMPAPEPTAEELAACAEWLRRLTEDPPPPPEEAVLLADVRTAYRHIEEQYGIAVNKAVIPKSTATPLFPLLGYFGLYAFPLGEITVLSDCPPAVRTFTVAHEMAHASGFIREADADALALLALLGAESQYLRYAGAAGILGRFLTVLSETSPGLWQSLSEGLGEGVRGELEEAGDVSDRSFLEALAAPVTYGETVRLVCALYRIYGGEG